MDDLSFYAAQVIDGVAYGSIYGIFALSIVLLYRANKLFNFAQTEIATLFVILAFFLLKKMSFASALITTICLAFLGGCLLHICIMRFVTERKTVLHSNESVVTIGFFTIFNAISGYIIGDEPQPFPSPFPSGQFKIIGVGVGYHSVGILCVSLLLMLIIFLCFRFTKVGLVFEAVAENIIAARLRGIRASNVLALAWGVTIATSVIGAVLMAPVLYVTPNMFVGILSYSLVAVVIGGLESPPGALVGGIIVGVVENLASNISFIGSELKFLVVLMMLVIVLLVRPRGLWGKSRGKTGLESLQLDLSPTTKP